MRANYILKLIFMVVAAILAIAFPPSLIVTLYPASKILNEYHQLEGNK